MLPELLVTGCALAVFIVGEICMQFVICVIFLNSRKWCQVNRSFQWQIIADLPTLLFAMAVSEYM